MAAWVWLKKNWKWFLLPIFGLIWFVGRLSKRSVLVSSELEQQAVRQGEIEREANEKKVALATQRGEALLEIEAEHSQTLESIKDNAVKEVQALRDDPDATNAFLHEVGRDVRAGKR